MRTDHRTRGVLARSALTLVILAILTPGVRTSPPASHASPEPGRDGTDSGRIAVDAGPTSIPSDGSLGIATTVRVSEPTPYLEIRLQIHRPAGQLLFQRTVIHSDVETSTVSAVFERELGDLSLAPDAYPYEIRVRTEVGEPREERVEGLLLVHDPEPAVVPLALVARVADVPGFDPSGNFVGDPASASLALDQVELLAGAVLDDTRLHLTLGVPGMILDSWSRVAAGYTFAGPDGLTEVDAEEETPRRYRSALDLLGRAARTGRLELLDIPYGDPDVGALAGSRALLDLGVHYGHSRDVYTSTLDLSPSAGTAVHGDSLPPGALEVLKERDIAWALLDAETLSAEEATPSPGPWIIAGSPVSALVIDGPLTDTLATPDPSQCVLHLFRHAISEEATVPVVASVEIGPGRRGAAERILSLAAHLEDVPWAETITASTAASAPALGSAIPPASIGPGTDAPADYDSEVAEARRLAAAFEYAAGVLDPDVTAAVEASLIAQSARWSGPDGRWSQADRGRAFASAALRGSSSFLDEVTLTAKDVTLSGPAGDLPISIANDSSKDLTVRLVLSTEDVHLPQGATQTLTLRPQENLHTVRVDLRSSLSGRIGIEIRAGDVVLDTAVTTVRASYLDRLAVVGGVALLLLGLLLYIRRRALRADAGSIP